MYIISQANLWMFLTKGRKDFKPGRMSGFEHFRNMPPNVIYV